MSLRTYSPGKRSHAAWIGAIPSHWHEVRLKFGLGLITDKASDDTQKVALENIESWTGRYIETTTEFEGEGTAFQSGDVLFGKLRPYLAKALLADAPGQAVGDFHVLRPTAQVDGRFALYYVLSRDFIAVVDGSTYGAKMPRASWDFVSNLPLPLPPFPEQTSIAAFLDRETGKIDALVEEQRRLIELLKEKRQAVVSHAVTKGLDLNAKMKPSGVEWLGEVPEHWEVRRVKSVLASIEQGWSPQCESYPASADEWGVLKVGCVNGGVFNPEENKLLPSDLMPLPELGLRRGDVLVSRANTRELVGGAAMIAEDHPRLLICDKLYRLRTQSGLCLPEFLALVLGTPAARAAIEVEATGASSSMLNIAQSTILEMPLPLPPVSEQARIVGHMRDSGGQLDLLASYSTRATQLLLERRAALISEAVTGKIDLSEVTRVAATSPDRGRVRMLVAAEIIDQLSHKKAFGRVKLQKLVYLAEVEAGVVELQGSYLREAAGPLDRELIADVEAELQRVGHVLVDQPDGRGNPVTYRLRGTREAYQQELAAVLGERTKALAHLITTLGDLDTRAVEAISTLYAVWNDALIDQLEPVEAEIVSGVLEDWHPEKAEKFKAEELHTWLGWMRRHKLVPRGTAPRTMTGRLFA